MSELLTGEPGTILETSVATVLEFDDGGGQRFTLEVEQVGGTEFLAIAGESLTILEVYGSQGPAGPPGVQGPAGPQGPPGSGGAGGGFSFFPSGW